MGCELDRLMVEAWGRVGARVLGDEGELRARLARRRGKMLTRYVPRVLCVAVRAADHRVNCMTAAMVPEDAQDPGREREHEVTLDALLVRSLCRPVWVLPGERVEVVRERLGCGDSVMWHMRKRGVVRETHYRGLGGRHGDIPVVFADGFLDGCSRGKRPPDELVRAFWEELPGRVPGELEQVLTRVPAWWTVRGRVQLKRWMWVCPGCGQRVRTVYYPVAMPDWAAIHGVRLPRWVDRELDALPESPGCFACRLCHGVRNMSRRERSIKKSWDFLVTYLSGGLLYGSEVERPGWFTALQVRGAGSNPHPALPQGRGEEGVGRDW